ncbi:NfeD-like protein [Planktothrix agardhii]|uniref:NfeD-like protein n=1 Tax=Planktothrix agardhii TaxID=1160 RepID=UPI001F398633|nr:NfeD-like protein [Planktothrix agardhii]MCF3574509.1 NfeD-like protein [Planktothrix agardhii 1812]
MVIGFDGIDFDTHFEMDVELSEPKNDPETLTSRSHRKSPKPAFHLPFLTLRFWTFGSCFFGLTGFILTKLNPLLPPILILAISLGIGVSFGTIIVGILGRLRRQQANSLILSEDMIGLSGTVEIPFDQNCKGKVRLYLKESMVDVVAITEDTHSFEKGDKVFVVGRSHNKVLVISEENLN